MGVFPYQRGFNIPNAFTKLIDALEKTSSIGLFSGGRTVILCDFTKSYPNIVLMEIVKELRFRTVERLPITYICVAVAFS